MLQQWFLILYCGRLSLSYTYIFHYNCIVSLANANGDDDEDDDNDEDNFDVFVAVGITFAVTLITSVLFTLVMVYMVCKIKRKPAKDDKRVTFSGMLMTAKDSTIKANESCDYEDYEFPEDLKEANSTSRYQSKPVAVMQQNPVNDTEAIYDDVK